MHLNVFMIQNKKHDKRQKQKVQGIATCGLMLGEN
jgi:hypothetical protein